MPNRETNISNPVKGMNLDSSLSSLDSKTAYIFALNARQESETGDEFNLTNDESNTLYVDFGDFNLIGKKIIPEANITIVMLVNPITGDSKISKFSNSDTNCEDNFVDINSLAISVNPCKTIEDIVNDKKLNFNINSPIHQIVHKITKDGIEIYWVESSNPPRWLNIDKVPKLSDGSLDANLIRIFPEFIIPKINITEVLNNGSLGAGSYQILGAYANSKGEEISQYYSATNPIPIFDKVFTNDLNYITTKSISITIKDLDTTFKFFNLAVGITKDSITNYYIIGTFDILNSTLNYLYTGAEETSRQLSFDEIFFRSPIYNRADTITTSDNRLLLGNISTDKVLNCQSIASNIHPKWISYRIPYNQYEGYNDAVNSVNYRSFMGDEVYPLDFVPIFSDGSIGSRFNIPGREVNNSDLELITNKDVQPLKNNPCDDDMVMSPKWKVYNTATVTDFSKEWIESQDKTCYIGPYQYGEFAYWESTELYDNNEDLWGNLANTPIRHHKFPDELISPRFSTEGDNIYIYPRGVKIDPDDVFEAIQNSDLLPEDKARIVGFKIIRGNRSNNASIVAKGLTNNVGIYKDADTLQEYYYGNYPYNDLRKDPYFATKKPAANFGLQYGLALDGFRTEESKKNYLFYSPDTLFNSIPVTSGLQIKFEAIDYGTSKGHFVQELSNAKHKFLTPDTLKTSILLGVNMGVDYSKKGLPSFNGSDAVAMIGSVKNLFENLTPYQNFGYSFHSYGHYDKSYAIPNNGNKQRYIDFGRRVTDGLNGVENGKNLNHLNRESAVFISTEDTIPFPQEYDPSIPIDNSRYVPKTYFDAENIVIMSDEEFFEFSKTDKVAQVHLGLGMFTAMSSLYGEDNNLLEIVAVIGGSTLGNYINNYTYDQFLQLKELENFQINSTLPINQTTYDIAFPGTIDVGTIAKVTSGGSFGFFNVASQFKSFEQWGLGYKAETSDRVDEESIHEKIGIPPIGNVLPTDSFLIPYVSSTVDSTREDCEGAKAQQYWPPVDPGDWNNGQYEFGPFIRTSRLFYTSCNGETITKEVNNVVDQQEWWRDNLGVGWPWSAGTFAAGTVVEYNIRLFCGTKIITWGEFLYAIYEGFITAKSMYYSYMSGTSELKLEDLPTIKESNISSYYTSIKRNIPNQWGQIYSYQSVDTGHLQDLYDTEGNKIKDFKPVFGGDTFINKFAFKIKVPIYTQNLVGYPDGSDVYYNKLGNYGHPMFWISSEPLTYKYVLNYNNLARGWGGIGLINKNLLTGNILSNVAYGVLSVGTAIAGILLVTGVGALIVEVITVVVAGVLFLIGWIFTNKGNEIIKATFSVFRQLLQQMMDNLGVKNLNLDIENKNIDNNKTSISYSGAHYLFVYGIPNFFVESDINTDYRHAENTTDKNFYPNVGNSIPDQWLMESNVPIITDNYYQYNPVYSKQNLQGFYRELPRDYNPDKPYNIFPTRVVYSSQSNQEEIENNWNIFKVNNYKDFPLNYGKLISLNTLEENKVLTRFENNLLVFNAYTKINTSAGTSIIGTGSMFENPAQEYSNTSIGYLGTQHKAFESTKYGYFFVDSKRGEIFNLKIGGGVEEISRKGLKNWFKENLPYRILKQFPDYNIDNSFKDVGLSLVWDNRYERLFVSKKDYICDNNNIELIDNKFFLNNLEVDITDSNYFTECSWTISYNPLLESWTSYHSFLPNYYIEQQNYFLSGINGPTRTLWAHGLTNKSYQTYYNKFYNFEIETVTNVDIPSKTLQSIQYRNDVLEYSNTYNHKILRGISFDQAEISDGNQTSGVLNLNINNSIELYSNTLPLNNTQSISIGLSNKDDIYKFNRFYNIVSDKDKDIYKYDSANVNKFVNPEAVDYNKVQDLYNSTRLKSDFFKVKLKNTKEYKYKFVFKWLINKIIKSVR